MQRRHTKKNRKKKLRQLNLHKGKIKAADAVGKSVLKVLTSATFIREHWGF
jgi:hypothetical protein